MYCHKCGTKNTDDAVFCYKCGSNLRGITSPSKKIIIFLICLLIAVSIFIGKLPSWKGDPYGTLIVSQSIIQNRTLNLNKVKRYWGINPVEYPHESYNYQVYRRDDNVYFSYPLGTSIISIPFVSIANTCGLNMLQHEKLMQEILASTVAIGIFLTIFIISLEYFSFVYSIFIGLIGFYGTTVGTVVGTGLWDSDYELFFSGLSILLIFLYAKKNYKIYIKGIELSSVLTGLFFLLAFISRPTASILIFSIFVFLILYDKRYFFKGAIISGILLMLYELVIYRYTGTLLGHIYESATTTSTTARFSTTNFITALEGFIWSPARSVFIFNPFLLILPAGMYYIISKTHMHDRKIKYFILALLLSGVITSLFLLFWTDWYGGGSYGPRIFADAIYWYFLLTIIVLGEITRFKIGPQKTMHTIFFSLMAIGVFINIQGIYNRYALEWNAYPNVDEYQNKVLFDWRYPQFLMTQKSLAEKCVTQGLEDRAVVSPNGWCEYCNLGIGGRTDYPINCTAWMRTNK